MLEGIAFRETMIHCLVVYSSEEYEFDSWDYEIPYIYINMYLYNIFIQIYTYMYNIYIYVYIYGWNNRKQFQINK